MEQTYVVELDEAYMLVVNFTYEGVIMDVYDAAGGELQATVGMTAEEWVEAILVGRI